MPNGATFKDLIASIGGANHGAKVSAVSQLSNGWKSAGLISGPRPRRDRVVHSEVEVAR